jgi:hypothetical protein
MVQRRRDGAREAAAGVVHMAISQSSKGKTKEWLRRIT